MLGRRVDPAEDFRHRLRVSRQILPARRMRSRLPRKTPPRAVALRYYRAILPILDRARAAAERALARVMPQLEARAAELRRDASGPDLNALMDAVGEEFFRGLQPSEIAALAEQFARATSGYEKEQAAAQVRTAFGVDVITREPDIAARSSAFVSENVALIKSIPSKFFDDVEKEVARAVSSGATPKQLAGVIADRFKVADDRAMLIARDQIGKYYGAVAEARQVAMGVTHYVWRTSNDERVREEHAAREGQTFAWDNPPEGGHPSEDFQCRCYAEPVLTPLLEGDEPLARAVPEEPEPEEPPETREPSAEDVARERAHAAERARDVAEQETQRAREAHAEEQARRLAEQEAAREKMRRLREAASEARARAEQEAAARVAAEAKAEAARKTTPPLREEHLASGDRFAKDREAHLDKMLARPVDLARLAEAAKDVSKPANQAVVRDEANRLVGEMGARIKQSDLENPRGREIGVLQGDLLSGNAAAVHDTDGHIRFASADDVAAAGRFFANAAKGVDYEARLASVEARDVERDAYLKALVPLREAEKRAANPNLSKKERAKWKAEAARLRDELPPRPASAEEQRAEIKREVDKALVLTHEVLHGHSPMHSGAYSGIGVVAEEVSTEMAARSAMEKFGIRSEWGKASPLEHDHAYNHFIGGVVESVTREARALGLSVTEAGAYERLKQASVAMKRDHTFLAENGRDHAVTLIRKIADALEIPESKRFDFEQRMLESFTGDISKRTLKSHGSGHPGGKASAR